MVVIEIWSTTTDKDENSVQVHATTGQSNWKQKCWFVVLGRTCDAFAHRKKMKDGKILCREKKRKT